MPWLHKRVAPCLAALGLLCPSAAIAHAQTVLGRGLGLRQCFYRVSFRVDNNCPWRCYATYTDFTMAQQVVNHLRWQGFEAYLIPVCRRSGGRFLGSPGGPATLANRVRSELWAGSTPPVEGGSLKLDNR
jgi:hypothetical protein